MPGDAARAGTPSDARKENLMPETTFTVRRLTVAVPSVRSFQRAYEAAVPDLPLDQVEALKDRGAPWPEMLALINDSAPHGFLIYDRTDLHPIMELAGDHANCVAYLMGNHTIAERMFGHDPRAMLYAPLRTLIWEEPAGQSWFTVDQPSTQFDSFHIPEITQVGAELDAKLAQLLASLDVNVPATLREGQPTAGTIHDS
jgi:uncharacterized protein (DUF302 family)